MPRSFLTIALIVLVPAGIAASSGSGQAALLLTDREGPHAAIVLPPQPSEAERKAAAELNTYLEKMGLAPLPTGDETLTARVYLGRATAFPRLPIWVPDLRFWPTPPGEK